MAQGCECLFLTRWPLRLRVKRVFKEILVEELVVALLAQIPGIFLKLLEALFSY